MEVKIISSLTEKHLDDLLKLYQNEFWSNLRVRSDVERMLDNTDIIVGLENLSGKLVGFCRVLTDYVYRATIFDVIVHVDYRHQGLGKLLMDTLMEHKDLRQVESKILYCLPEMFSFYEQWGFTKDLGKVQFMMMQ